MKKLKIRSKLLIGFLTIAFLAVCISIAGIWGVHTIARKAQSIDSLADNTLIVTSLQSNIHSQRAAYRGAALKESYDLHDSALEDLQQLEHLDGEFKSLLRWSEGVFNQGEAAQRVKEISAAYYTYAEVRDRCVDMVRAGKSEEELLTVLLELTAPMEETLTAVGQLSSYNIAVSNSLSDQSLRQANSISIGLLIGVAIALSAAIALGFYISLTIARPIRALVQASRKLSAGSIAVNLPESGSGEGDEIGELSGAFREMANQIRQQANLLAHVADGDFRETLPVRSDSDVMNGAINNLIAQSNRMISEISVSSNQVNYAVTQITQAAQELSLGSNEQANAIHHFSESLMEMRKKFEENAAISSTTLSDVRHTMDLMEESDKAMQQVVHAMQDIRQSARSIATVVKVIEDISFQTNILALNAAVEAARAGQHGKGFAVVADEVRNLATKSAKAVKETTDLIQGGMDNMANGNQIVEDTIRTIQEVHDIALRNTEGIVKISEVSLEQSSVMDEVADNISQISAVIETSSASAQEIASSTQEILAQTGSLLEMTRHFQLADYPLIPEASEAMALSADDSYSSPYAQANQAATTDY